MLKIDYISDLHAEFFLNNQKSVFWETWILKKNSNSEILIIAWDISEDSQKTIMTMDLIIKYFNYKKIIITFWNHDIRLNHNQDLKYWVKNSIEKYHFLIENLHLYKDIVHVIDKEDFVIEENKVILTWNMGWYNYSWVSKVDKYFLEKHLNADFDKMQFLNFYSNDKKYIKFNEEIKSNLEFAEYLENKLIDRLENIKKNEKFQKYRIVWISHIKPSRKLEKMSEFNISYNKSEWKKILEVPKHERYNFKMWSIYGNLFYVNENIHKIYSKYWVKYWIYGHTHNKTSEVLNSIKYNTNAFWYYIHSSDLVSKEIKTLKIKD